MRNLKRPGHNSKTNNHILYEHECVGLNGLNSYSAFCSKGLLKIINKHIDEEAKGYHKNKIFVIRTRYTKDELLDYLTTNYKPCSYIPVFSKALFNTSQENTIEKIKDKHPEYYSKILRSRIAVENWLKEKEYTKQEIKGDVLIELFHDLKNIIHDDEIIEYTKSAGIPYTITKKNGYKIKKIWYSPLFNKSLGRYGKGNLFSSYLSAIKDINRDSWDAALFGASHKVMGDYPIFQFDLKNWGGSREGKTDKNGYSKGYGTTSGESSIGTAADVIMLIASLSFFKGYVGEKYSQDVDMNTDTPLIKKKPVFTLCVRNNAPAFHTGLWSEMTTSKSSEYLLGVEEIFVPIWKEPLTFEQARERLALTAALPISTSINSNRDLMKHLSLHAKQTGIDSYIRFSCVGRGGTGMAQLNFLIPVEEFEPHKNKRNDIVHPFISLYNECLFKLRKDSLPHNLRSSVEAFVMAINEFTMSRATPREIMYAFLELVSAVKITDNKYLNGRLSKNNLSPKNFKIPHWWVDTLCRNGLTSEMKIAKSIAANKQECGFNDIRDLLEDKLDTELIKAYMKFLRYIEDIKIQPSAKNKREWLPTDYLINAKFFSYKKYDMADSKNAWKFLISNGDTFGALSIALDALYSKKLIKSYIYPFASTEKENMKLALRIPLSDESINYIRRQLR